MENSSPDDPTTLTKNIIDGIRESAKITTRAETHNSYSKFFLTVAGTNKDSAWRAHSNKLPKATIFWNESKFSTNATFPKESTEKSKSVDTSVENKPLTPHIEDMTVSREELDAKLEALRSDMRAGNADLRSEFHAMRADVAGIRTAINQDLSAVVSSMGDLKGAAGEVKGSLDGVKTSLTTVQWLVGTLLAAAALYVAIAQLSAPPNAPQSAQQAPIIINVPAGTTPATPSAVPASR